MKRRRRATPVPMLLAELGLASWETIARRWLLMAGNTCSPAEYQRMLHEKMQAAAISGQRFLASGGKASAASLLAPWSSRAKANAKRLRRG